MQVLIRCSWEDEQYLMTPPPGPRELDKPRTAPESCKDPEQHSAVLWQLLVFHQPALVSYHLTTLRSK